MHSQIIETDCPSGKRAITEFLAGLVRRAFGLSVNSKTALISDKPCIFFANHTSHLDFLLLWSALPGPVRNRTVAAAAADYWCKNSLRRWIAGHFFHAIMIERSGISRSNNPVSAILKAIDDGKCVIVFPEGGRTDGPEVSELKSGLYHIARKRPEIQLIPAFIRNANRVLPKGHFFPIPILCSIEFGLPMQIRADEYRTDFVQRARSALEKCRAA